MFSLNTPVSLVTFLVWPTFDGWMIMELFWSILYPPKHGFLFTEKKIICNFAKKTKTFISNVFIFQNCSYVSDTGLFGLYLDFVESLKNVVSYVQITFSLVMIQLKAFISNMLSHEIFDGHFVDTVCDCKCGIVMQIVQIHEWIHDDDKN